MMPPPEGENFSAEDPLRGEGAGAGGGGGGLAVLEAATAPLTDGRMLQGRIRGGT